MRAHVMLLMLLAGCGSHGEPASQPVETAQAGQTTQPEATPPAEPGPEDTEPAPAAATVELHEWAVIDVTAAGQIELGAGPTQGPPIAVRKPVIYAHLLDADSATLAVRARFPAGTAVEHWPPGDVTPGAVSWPEVRVRRGPCPAGAERDLTAGACNTPDGMCEVAELSSYATTDHDCMGVGNGDAGLLFYRARLPQAAFPLRVERGADGAVTVTAAGDLRGAPGSLLRVSTGPRGGLVIARAPPPRRGSSISLPRGTDALDAAAEREGLGGALHALGMTGPEAEAFLNAWAGELFGPGTRGPVRRSARLRRRDFVLYWLPLAAVSSIATLETEPAANVRRAFMVRVDVTALASP